MQPTRLQIIKGLQKTKKYHYKSNGAFTITYHFASCIPQKYAKDNVM